MQQLLALLIGVLFAAGIYLVLRRSVVKLILGIAFLSQGANLLLLWSGGLKSNQPPILHGGPQNVTDPIPQALVLTAIVIGFGLLAFLLVLVSRAFAVTKTENLDEYHEEEL